MTGVEGGGASSRVPLLKVIHAFGVMSRYYLQLCRLGALALITLGWGAGASAAQAPDATSIRWVEIAAARFEMGCTAGDPGCRDDEWPRHNVEVPAFEIAATETTNAQYRVCVSAGGCAPVDSTGGDHHPVVNVTWSEARAFCDWAGGRLPSEAEWELAARAGPRDWRYPNGPELDRESANYGEDECCAGARQGVDRWVRTAPVASLTANRHGVYDMAGNVWEWVQDAWHDTYQGAPADGTAWESEDASVRVLRGGSWFDDPSSLRVSVRRRHDAAGRFGIFGFRCARDGAG